MVQVKDISDEEVITTVKNYWDEVKPGTHLFDPTFIYPTSILNTLSSKYPEKVVLRKLEQMVHRNILEYGVSLRNPWLVNK